MNPQTNTVNVSAPVRNRFFQLSGLAAIAFGAAYLVIIGLYIPLGARPSGSEALLAYFAGNTTTWWAILGLSVLTDFLLVPVAVALYRLLKGFNTEVMLVACTLIGLFVVLDLALTWTNYAVLIELGSHFHAASSDFQRAAILSAATYPSTVVESNLLFVYNSLTLSAGIFLTALVMLQGIFNKSTAYLGLVAGALGIVAVTSSFFATSVSGVSIILASLFTTLWILMVGFRLFKLGR